MESIYIYVLVGNNSEWEDMIIYLTKEDAINASKNHPNMTVEVFSKSDNHVGYKPAYCYYKDGEYYESS
jgi:hypothetical protein